MLPLDRPFFFDDTNIHPDIFVYFFSCSFTIILIKIVKHFQVIKMADLGRQHSVPQIHWNDLPYRHCNWGKLLNQQRLLTGLLQMTVNSSWWCLLTYEKCFLTYSTNVRTQFAKSLRLLRQNINLCYGSWTSHLRGIHNFFPLFKFNDPEGISWDTFCMKSFIFQ